MEGLTELAQAANAKDAAPPPPPRRRRGPVLVGLVVCAGLLAGGYFWWQRSAGEPTAPVPVVQAPAPVETAGSDAPPVPTAELDARAREALARLSAEPEWATWLTERDVLRRLVGAVSSVAAGELPRTSLGFLSPKGAYTVKEEGTRVLVDPAAFERHEVIGRVVRGMDMSLAAAALEVLSPLLEQLHREGAPPGVTFRDEVDRAAARILSVPVLEGDIELVARGAHWAYADPVLESLPAADKLLLRLGPGTLAALQDQVRALQAANP